MKKFLRWNSQHLLLASRKGSKTKKNSEKVSEWSPEWARCSFDNNAGKTSPEIPKYSTLTREMIKKIKNLDRKLIHYKMIICTNRMRFQQTCKKFWKNSETSMLESQKNHWKICFNREPFPSEWPSVHVEVSSDKCAEISFAAETPFSYA